MRIELIILLRNRNVRVHQSANQNRKRLIQKWFKDRTGAESWPKLKIWRNSHWRHNQTWIGDSLMKWRLLKCIYKNSLMSIIHCWKEPGKFSHFIYRQCPTFPSKYECVRKKQRCRIAHYLFCGEKQVRKWQPKTFKPIKYLIMKSNHNRNRLYFKRNNMQGWDLIVLLVSKVAELAPTMPEMEQDESAGVLHKQRMLAEICEMFRISHLVHQGLVNIQPLIKAGQDLSLHGDMTIGNKIALLSGDYLSACSCAQLAKLRYP